jgi:hypothetical protein
LDIILHQNNQIVSGNYPHLENAANFQTPRVFENPWGLEIQAITTRMANFKFAIQRPKVSHITFWRAVVEKRRADA